MKPDLLTREELYKLVPCGGRIAELGVQWGYNAAAMLWICRPAELWLIDGWCAFAEHGTDFDQVEQQRTFDFVSQAAAAQSACRVVRERTHDAARLFADGYFDFVYVDASHRYQDVKQDIADWWPMVRPGGMLAGHDYLGQVEQAVNERFPTLDHLSGEYCGSWAVVKPHA